jgi:hypothetical protein
VFFFGVKKPEETTKVYDFIFIAARYRIIIITIQIRLPTKRIQFEMSNFMQLNAEDDEAKATEL